MKETTPDSQERRAHFDAIHRQVEDARSDRNARLSGLESGIGRMSHITDRLLQRLFGEIGIHDGMRLLDLGSGRGFLARWLQWKNLSIEYLGVDFSEAAIDAAAKNAPGRSFVLADFLQPLDFGEFDIVCAIESTGDGFITDGLARAIMRSLKQRGVGLATIVTLKLTFADVEERSRRSVERAGGRAEILDVTADAMERAKLLSEAVLNDNDIPAGLREKARRECMMFLEQIASGVYGYGVVRITRPEAHRA